MADIAISAVTQNTIGGLQRTAALADQVRERLATGRRVNRPSDNAPAFFLAKSLTERAEDLLAVKDKIGQSISALGGAIAGTEALTDLVRQAKAVATSARGGTAEARQAAAEQFDVIRVQIDTLAADVGFAGLNLLASPPDTLEVEFNERGTSALSIGGSASDAAALGIGVAATDFGNFAADGDIATAIGQLDDAVTALRSTTQRLGSNVSLITTRLDFTENLVNTLETGAGKLVDADLDEEAANLLSVRARDALGIAGLSVARDSERLILQLLGNAS
ncbi:MAG: flagellin [Rhodospirillales bacterium]|jgi:flagellin-like hook-associated protein FlgL|nr:flagellin [Rhodospirillales bacterium]MDP6774893.1 flagellin [Rhodospirillales bacterium]